VADDLEKRVAKAVDSAVAAAVWKIAIAAALAALLFYALH
jgi:hypothetical protein